MRGPSCQLALNIIQFEFEDVTSFISDINIPVSACSDLLPQCSTFSSIVTNVVQRFCVVVYVVVCLILLTVQ